jgi:ATP-dependent Clp protease ATP-binding subunit ClpA
MEEPERTWIRGTPAAMRLYLNASWDAKMDLPNLSVEDVGKYSLESQSVIRSFIARNPETARGFADRAGFEIDAWVAALAEDQEPEQQPEPSVLKADPTDEEREAFEALKRIEDERAAKGSPSPFSKPLKEAVRLAISEAKSEGRERYSLGHLVSAVLRTESNAKAVTLRTADAARLSDAFDWLEAQPDPPDTDVAATSMSNMKKMIDKLWQGIVQQGKEKGHSEKVQAQLEETYEKNPDRYEQPVDLAAELRKPLPESPFVFHMRSGICLRAAANEARIRHSPNVKLDHMFYALLQDGTDTSAFLDLHGVDRDHWRRIVEEQLPRFAEGPQWPDNARDLGMNNPDSGDKVLRKKPVPENLDVSQLSKEERAEYFEVQRGDKPFTDLAWLIGLVKEDETIGFRLLTDAGITKDAIKAEVKAIQTRDPNWFANRPDLVEGLRERNEGPLGHAYDQQVAIKEAAMFEARSRRAPNVDFGHVVLALLVDGTDTSSLVDSLGVDRAELAEEIDMGLPKSESGPYFPEVLHAVNSCFIDMHLQTKGRCSDLKFFESLLGTRSWRVPTEPHPIVELLTEHGLTLDAVRGRLKELGIELNSSPPAPNES